MEVHSAVSSRLDSTALPREVRASISMRRVNTRMRELETFPLSDPIYLFCECRNATCHSVVPMSVAAFDATVADQTGWLLAEGHEPSEPWQPSEPLPVRETPAPDSRRTTRIGTGRADLSRTASTGLRHRS
jgi:hypothetical protein